MSSEIILKAELTYLSVMDDAWRSVQIAENTKVDS